MISDKCKFILIIKVRQRAKIRNRYNQVPYQTQDTIWEKEKHTIRHHKREPKVSPFPGGGHTASINRHV